MNENYYGINPINATSTNMHQCFMVTENYGAERVKGKNGSG